MDDMILLGIGILGAIISAVTLSLLIRGAGYQDKPKV